MENKINFTVGLTQIHTYNEIIKKLEKERNTVIEILQKESGLSYIAFTKMYNEITKG